MHFCVVTARYSETGVPLAQLRLARSLAARGHEVDLVLGYVPEGLKPAVPPNVRAIVWQKSRTIFMVPKLIAYLKSSRPDAVFSAEDNLNATVILSAMLARSATKLSCSSRIAPLNVFSSIPFTKPWMLKQTLALVIGRADVWTCVAKDMVPMYERIFPKGRFASIYNIVVDSETEHKMRETVLHPWFEDSSFPICVAAGHLAPRKGYTDLLNAIAILKQRGEPVRLVLLGDGPQRLELQALAKQLRLTEFIWFEGHVANPVKYFARSDVFVLSSLVEGMPNVLIEAMFAGCTPVATDCPTGPREILAEGQYGYLVPVSDPEALADGIEQAIKTPIPRAVLQEAASAFKEEVVIQCHLEALGFPCSADNDACIEN